MNEQPTSKAQQITKTNNMKTVAEQLNHDFSKGSLRLYDSNGKIIYSETSRGYWYKSEYDSNGKQIYHETSSGYWVKREYDTNGNRTYFENSDGYWEKSEYDANGNRIHYENSDGYWYKREYDSNGNRIYYESSYGNIEDNRPKESCEGKVVEIDGKTYKLVELNQNK